MPKPSTQLRTWMYSSPTKVSLCPLVIPFYLSPSCSYTSLDDHWFAFCHYKYLHYLEIYMDSYSTNYFGWLLLVSIIILRVIHIFVCINSLVLLSSISLYECTRIYSFTCWWVLGLLQFQAIENKDAMTSRYNNFDSN